MKTNAIRKNHEIFIRDSQMKNIILAVLIMTVLIDVIVVMVLLA